MRFILLGQRKLEEKAAVVYLCSIINNTRSFEPFLEKIHISEEDWERKAKKVLQRQNERECKLRIQALVRVLVRNLDKFGTRHSSPVPVFSLFFSTILRFLTMFLGLINPTLTGTWTNLPSCYYFLTKSEFNS